MVGRYGNILVLLPKTNLAHKFPYLLNLPCSNLECFTSFFSLSLPPMYRGQFQIFPSELLRLQTKSSSSPTPSAFMTPLIVSLMNYEDNFTPQEMHDTFPNRVSVYRQRLLNGFCLCKGKKEIRCWLYKYFGDQHRIHEGARIQTFGRIYKFIYEDTYERQLLFQCILYLFHTSYSVL